MPTAAAGAPLHPGSLNVVLEQPWLLPSDRISLSADVVGRLVYLVPCTVGSRRCFILRTARAEAAGGDEHRILEILAEVRLRDVPGVADGDRVEVVVADPAIA